MRRLQSPRALATVAAINLIMLWIIVPSGAIVRLTGSGLGCPDWPLCDGNVVPATAGHAVIEYINRLLSGVVVVVAIATWFLVLRAAGTRPALRRWSLAAAACSAAQAPLGAITVLSGLHPLAVGSHFLLSMVALACGAMTWIHARDRATGRARGWDLRRGPLALGVLVGLGAVLVTGVIVTAAGPHPGDSEVIRTWGNLGELAVIHVRLAFLFTALAAVLMVWMWREGGVDAITARLTIVALPLVAFQIAVGEYQFRHGLPWKVVVVHVSTAALLWAVVAALAYGILRPGGTAATREG